jgi:hypothetical protein
MAAEPTSSERALMVDMASLADWCKISCTAPPAPATATTPPAAPLVSDVQSLCAFMQAAPDEHFRSIATLTEADWATATQNMTFNGHAPSIVLRGKIALFHITARRLCNLAPWPQAALPAQMANNLPPPLPLCAQALLAGPARVNLPIINIGKVLDQRMSDEVTFLDATEILTMNARYIQVMEVAPPSNKSVTREQLTALQFTIDQGRVIYADFAIYGKHQTRRARAMAFKGMVMQAGGTLHVTEILGPATLELWKESYDCLFTALIMLDAVRRPQLAAYRAKICLLHAQYGPKCWALLYQADVRCRSELMDELRYRLTTKHNATITQGLPSTFDVTRPWDSVWAAAVLETEFWDTEFKHWAMMIATNTARSGDIVESDAAIAAGASSAALVPGPAWERKTQATAKAVGKPKKEGVCTAFNKGNCHGNTCSRGWGKHQCSICSQPHHGATTCPRVGQDPKQSPANDKAREKQFGKGDKKRGEGWQRKGAWDKKHKGK